MCTARRAPIPKLVWNACAVSREPCSAAVLFCFMIAHRFIRMGRSAGLAHAIALISLFSGKTVPPTMAMTVTFPFPPLNFYKYNMSNLDSGGNFPPSVVLLVLVVLKRSLLEPFELESRPYCYLRRIKRSKMAIGRVSLSSYADNS